MRSPRVRLPIAALALSLAATAHALPEVEDYGICLDGGYGSCPGGGEMPEEGYGSVWQGTESVTETYYDAEGRPYTVTTYLDGRDAYGADHNGLMAPTFSGDPVIDGTGEMYWRETDAKLPGWGIPFVLERTYASRRFFDGPFGPGWDHSYDQHISYKGCIHDRVLFSDGALSNIELTQTTSTDPNVKKYLPGHGEALRLEWRAYNSFPWVLTDATTITRTFDEAGNLRFISDRAGHTLFLTWQTPTKGADQLKTVVDTTGRTIYFNYQGKNLTCVTLDANAQSGCQQGTALVTYDYHQQFHTWLTRVHDGNGNGNSYTYDESSITPRFDPVVADEQVEEVCKASCDPSQGNGTCTVSACDMAKNGAVGSCTQNPASSTSWESDTSRPKYPANQLQPYGSGSGWELVLDGNPATQWSAGTGFTYWQVELPLPEQIGRVTLSNGTGAHTKDLQVWLSPYGCAANRFDIVAWDQLPDVDRAVKDVSFDPEPVRCIRIYAVSAWGTQGMALAGLQAYDLASGRPLIDPANGTADAYLDGTNTCIRQTLANVPYCRAGTGCMDECRAFVKPGGRVYGRLDDLNGNLMTVVNADGVLVVRNVYGNDKSKPSFDKVIDQQVGPVDRTDRHVTWDYHDLATEPQPSDAHVQAASDWQSLKLCPVGGSTSQGGLTVVSYGAILADNGFSFGRNWAQRPAYAVVIRDLNGGARTKYFDRSWELLREVDSHDHDTGQTPEQTDYNYLKGRMTAMNAPGRGRVCLELDDLGRPAQRTELAGPGGGATRVTLYRRGSDGQVTEVFTDPFGDASVVHWDHDGPTGRVTRIDRDVSASQKVSTWMYYDDRPSVDQNSVILDQPSRIATPWGGRRLDFCAESPCLPQPDAVTENPEGVSTRTSYSYDPLGRVTGQTEGGLTTTTSYDPGGRPDHVVRNVDGVKDDTYLFYFNLDKPWYVYNSEHWSLFEYDAHGGVSYQADYGRSAWPKKHCYNRDLVDGRILAELGPEGALTRYGYDELGRLVSVDRGYPGWAQGEDTTWAASCLANLPTSAVPGLERVESVVLGPGGLPASRTAGGITTRYLYDGLGQLVDSIDGDGNHARVGYDVRGRKIWEAVLGPSAGGYAKPQLGDAGLTSMVEHVYDLMDREVRTDRWHFVNGQKVEATLAASTVRAYGDDTGHVDLTREAHPTVTVTEGTNPATVTTLDGAGREIKQVLPDGSTLTSTWWTDRFVQEAHPTPVGVVHRTRVFDSQHFLSVIYDDDAAVVKQAFHDVRGRLVWEQSATAGMRYLGYDGFGRVTSDQVSANGLETITTRSEYDREDRPTARIDGRNKRTQLAYDALGRRTSVIDPDGRAATSTYVPGSSRPQHTSDMAGTTHDFYYSYAGRLSWEYVHDGPGVATAGQWWYRYLTYNPAGKIALAVLYAPTDYRSVRFDYDSLGNVVRDANDQLPSDLAVGHVWDGQGHVTSTTVGADTILRFYERLGRLSWVLVDGAPVAYYNYAGLGGPTVVWYGMGQGNVQAAPEYHTYDKLGHLTDLALTTWDWYNVQTTVASFHYAVGRDGAARQRLSHFGNGPAWNDFFQVDQLGRVTGESRIPTGGPGALANYLGWNHWIGNSDVATWVDRSVTPTARAYTLDNADNRTRAVDASGTTITEIGESNQALTIGGVAVRGDGAGEVTGSSTQEITWNGFGQPMTARQGKLLHTYAYDPLGRRLSDTVSGKTTWYLWDGDELAGISAATANGSPPASSAFTLRVGGPGRDRHLALYDRAAGLSALRYLHQGEDGSVVAVTDAAGLVEGYVYNAFGQVTVVDPQGVARPGGSAIKNRLQYQGHIADADLGLVWMRTRAYNPAWGRFLSRDPIGIDGGLNLYGFVHAAPLVLVDPTGHNPSSAGGGGPDDLMVPTFEGSPGSNDLMVPKFALSTVKGDGLAYIDFTTGTHIFFNTMRAFGEFEDAMEKNHDFRQGVYDLFMLHEDWMVVETDDVEKMHSKKRGYGSGGLCAFDEHTIYINERWGAGTFYLLGDKWDFAEALVHEFGHAYTGMRDEDWPRPFGDHQRMDIDGLDPHNTHNVPQDMKPRIIDEWVKAYNSDWEGYLVPGNQIDNRFPK